VREVALSLLKARKVKPVARRADRIVRGMSSPSCTSKDAESIACRSLSYEHHLVVTSQSRRRTIKCNDHIDINPNVTDERATHANQCPPFPIVLACERIAQVVYAPSQDMANDRNTSCECHMTTNSPSASIREV
jgi:hypothetical protein